MKRISRLLTIAILFVVGSAFSFAQFAELQNYKPLGLEGVNVFEAPKTNDMEYTGKKVRVGGAFALQWQAIDQSNDLDNLIELGYDFNLPTANLNLDVQLADGVLLNMEVYLASNHHNEAWVKGGYFQIDKLDFISEGFLEDLMKNVRIKIGQMENNYGDAHFRRSDNGNAIMNPFVGNYIMDAFVTEVGAEAYYFNSGFIGMLGFSNAKLNQSVTNPGKTTPAIIAKLGYDDYLTEDFRFRLTGSVYHTAQAQRVYLYSGDRTGSRFYSVIQVEGDDANFRAGRYAPGFKNKITAIMINNLLKYNGFELFSTFETSSDADISWTQIASELIFRFGAKDQFYVGGRYNMVSGEDAMAIDEKVSIDRIQAGFGWFLTENILAKLNYVTQNYNDFMESSNYAGASFNGITFEATIGF
jgi:hypothetical protein